MRFLSFHCDYFWYKTTKKSRSPLREKLNESNKEGKLEDVLVLFLSVEREDEENPNSLKETINEIESIIEQLKVRNIVFLSFAHLFGTLSSPKFALNYLKELETNFTQRSYHTLRPPFGWFNELELRAKGHPLSRISRKI